ncbi:uncharacterized protein PITG_12860 [Phytophthora infestans T30-4]|uniref:DDE-1 domain-containing protein n=1 Tax=Phytophthora infestans (strain T30-4) TaxID=403677 RepID=D0NLB7_PHYIT|nr:uncharacterized protein PITG_12860 [Phytophthora infestans T30-4]EEY60435.1 conserved hypothetical protein [Phytophthora infestans T30-4]|eukprot:XP_002900231.1 conserved hypothetical protein [Phytophthora infestans T30-4]
MDETSFYYDNVPRGSMCLNKASALKQNKSRLTLPRWLNQKPQDIEYESSKKAWMTTKLYKTWLLDLDNAMRASDRRILLLVDNASSHSETGLELKNVRVAKLPLNTTSKLQPLDQHSHTKL